MALSLLFMRQIGKMFLIMGLGILGIRSKLLSKDSGKQLSALLIYFIIPCAIFSGFQIDYTPERIQGLLLATLAAVLTHILYIALSRLVGSPLRLRPSEKACLIYTNGGNLIMPIVNATLGAEWLLYTCGYMAVTTALLWIHGKGLMTGGRIDWKRALLNANILSITAGVLFFLARVRLPDLLLSAVQDVGGMLGPASMLVIGISIGGIRRFPKKMLSRISLMSILRLLVYPALAILMFAALGLPHLFPDADKILVVSVLALSAPTAAVVVQMAQMYDCEPESTSVISAVTMLFCIFTIPLMTWLYQLLSGVVFVR